MVLCAPHSAHRILYKQPGLGFADLRSAKFGFANIRLAALAAISLSLTLAGCDTGGGGGGGDSSGNGGGTPTCTGDQILKNDQCEACPDPQYPNADRTACVTNCPDGEIKPIDKPTCEALVTCAEPKVHNPTDNTCVDLECGEDEVVNTTTNPPACISRAKCQGDSSSPTSILGNACIRDEACQNMADHVAQHDGVCMECTGSTPTPNMATGMCDADNDDDGLLDGSDNCPALANADQTNTDDDSQGDACDTDDDNDGTADASDNCPTVANADQANADDDTQGNACDADDDNDSVADSSDAFPLDECASVDSDSDGLPDALVADCDTDLIIDACPMGVAGRPTGTSNAATADPDGDGCKNSEDTDDDNDGLIEIATAQELDNMRHNLAGTSYNDGSTASTAGGPASATDYCDTATNNVYLCGYELVADIDFAGPDGYPEGHDDDTDDNIDLNGNADGNFTPIGTVTGTNFPAFTARFHGNGHAISHLDIQHSYTAPNNSDTKSTRVGFFTSCENTTIRDIFFVNPSLSASHTGGVTYGLATLTTGLICSEVSNATFRNVHVQGAVLSVSANRDNYTGVLIGSIISGTDSSVQYSSSLGHSISVNIGSGSNGNYLGGLIGHSSRSFLLIHSRSDGAITLGSSQQVGCIIGGLVGNRADQNLEIAASHAGGSIHNQSSADQNDTIGGLLGAHNTSVPANYFRIRNSLSTVQICDGALSGSTCSAGAGNDRIGALIGQYLTTAESIVQNNLAIGLTEGKTTGDPGDAVGFIGRMPNNVDGGATAAEVTTALNAAFVGNYYDSAVTTLGSRVGQLPTVAGTAVMDSDLTGIRPRTTTQLQVAAPSSGDDAPATSVYHGWDTNRWYFKAGSYPEPRYYDYEWDHDGNEATAAISIDICEDITANDPELDQGDPLKPDCGDKLSAFPRE